MAMLWLFLDKGYCRPGDALPLPRLNGLGRRCLIRPLFNFNKRQHTATPGDNIDFPLRYPEVAGDDPPAGQPQAAHRRPLGKPSSLLSPLS